MSILKSFIMEFLDLVLLLSSLFAMSSPESDVLSCTNREFCYCNGSVLLCNIKNAKFVLPDHIALEEEIVSVSIQGDNYSIEIPEKSYNQTWSAIKHLEIIGSRNNLTLPYMFTQSLKNLTILRIRNSNLSFIAKLRVFKPQKYC